MTAIIHLARFGNRSGEHTLLSHTGMNEEVLANAVWRTDLPPHGDAETIGTFVTGYPLGENYVVQRTEPDRSATRSGMVATATAFLPSAVLGAVDLEAILTYLGELPGDLYAPADPEFFRMTANHRHPPGAAALASTLLANRRAAWRGTDGLDRAIACLWRHLRAEERSTLVFGAAYHPEPLAIPVRDRDLLVLAVPDGAQARWAGWHTVGPESATSDDPVRDAFYGEDDGTAGGLAAELLGHRVAFDQWRHLVSLAELQGRVATHDHERLRSMLQLLGVLAPDPSTGTALKARALDRLTDITPRAAFADIRGLRGVPWPSLPGRGLPALVRPWTKQVLGDRPRPEAAAAAVLEVLAGTGDELCVELDSALRSALAQAGREARRATAVELLQGGPEATEWLATASSHRADVDTDLAAAAGDKPPPWLANLAIKRRLSLTHAASADVAEPVAAWRAHIAIKKRSSDSDTLLAGRVGAAGTVAAALQLDDTELMGLAADRVADDPNLLHPLDPTDVRSRTVWAEAVSRGANPWGAISAAHAVPVLLDLLVASENVPVVLLKSIARTTFADLSGVSQRAAVWDRLPDVARRPMLVATANALGRRLQPGDPAPEPALAEAMVDTDVLGPLAHDDAAQAVNVLRAVEASRPDHAVVVARRGRFDTTAATALGDLIVARRWKRAAESVVDLAATRPDLAPAASRVSGMFSIFERLRRYAGFSDGVRGLTTQGELRDALSDLVAELYSRGPSDRAIWERAGGLPADLPDAATPRHRWGLALSAIQHQRAGAPLLADLLRVMRQDYPNNVDLQTLTDAIPKEPG